MSDASPSTAASAAAHPWVARPLWLEVARASFPIACGMAGHACFNLVDLLMVGRLGAAAVAGVHVATTVNFLPMIFANGISVVTLARMSQLLGAGRDTEARALSTRAFWLLTWLGLALGIAMALGTGPCVDVQGVSGAARDAGFHYLLISNLGTVTMFSLLQASTSLRAQGETLAPFLLLIGCNLLNIGLNWWLIFGFEPLGIPALGAPGAAYATVTARFLGALVAGALLARRGRPLRLGWVAPPLPRGTLWITVVGSLPNSVQMAVRALTVIVLTRIASDIAGQGAVAALGVTTRLDTVVLFGAAGFASAATAIAGRNLGAREIRRARVAVRWAGAYALLFAAVPAACFALLAESIVRTFIAEADALVVDAAREYLLMAAFWYPLAAYSLALGGGINGSGRMVPPMVLDLLAFVGFLLPAVITIVSLVDGVSMGTVWVVLVAANLLLALGYLVYVERGRWLRRVLPR